MPDVPLVYTVSWKEKERRWKVWKGGSLSGRPSRVFETKRNAESYADEQADKYSADGVVIQNQSGRISTIKSDDQDLNESPDAVVEVEFDEIGSLGWMVISRWDNGLLGHSFGTKKDAVETAKEVMEKVNAKYVLARNRQNSGTQKYWNSDVPDSEKQ